MNQFEKVLVSTKFEQITSTTEKVLAILKAYESNPDPLLNRIAADYLEEGCLKQLRAIAPFVRTGRG